MQLETTFEGLNILIETARERYNSLVNRETTPNQGRTYNYSAHMIETINGVIRTFFGGNYDDDSKGMKGDHVFQYRTVLQPVPGGLTNIRATGEPLFKKGDEEGYPTAWFSDNVMDPEVVIMDGLWFMFCQVQIQPGEKVDISGATALTKADRIMLLFSNDGLTWTRYESRGVFLNIQHQRKTFIHHPEVILVGNEFWLYAIIDDQGAVPGDKFYNKNKYWRFRSTDPTTFDLMAGEEVFGMAQIGNQMGYFEDFGEIVLFTRITFTTRTDGKTVPTMQFSSDGLTWGYGSNKVELADPYPEPANCNSYFLGLCTQNGTGRIKSTGDGEWEAYYAATAASGPGNSLSPPHIWDSRIGYGKLIFNIN